MESIVYWIGAAIAVILFVYLLLALVKPEWFA
jgi:K+-transporting ATPase KdpF subunit